MTDEITRLQRYEELVWFIANDYHELSHDKVYSQRDYWKKLCKELIKSDHQEDVSKVEENFNEDLDF